MLKNNNIKQEWDEIPYVGESRKHHVLGYFAAKEGNPRVCPKGLYETPWYDGYDKYMKMARYEIL